MWNLSDPLGGPLSRAISQDLLSQYARLAHDWNASPRLLTHIVFYYNRFGANNDNSHRGIDGANLLGIRGLDSQGYPAINYGAGPFVTLAQPGQANAGPWASSSWGGVASVSFFHGHHFMKAGAERTYHLYARGYNNNPTFNFAARATAIPNQAFSGTQTGYSFASYLLGIVDSASLTDPYGVAWRHTYQAFYFQDDFKVSSQLTLQLGLRWDYNAPTREALGRYASWDPNTIDPATGLKGAYDFAGSCSGCTGRNYFGRRDWHNFGPRIGFAWQPISHWTVRGAYGILYAPDPSSSIGGSYFPASGTYQLNAASVDPWRGIFNWDNGMPANTYVPASRDPSWGDVNQPAMIDPRYGTMPYVQQWNLNIQRELARGLVMDVGYVGTKSTALHAGELEVLNQLPPSVLQQYGRNLTAAIRSAADAANYGVPYPYPGFVGTVAQALAPFPQIAGARTVSVFGAPLGFATYNALHVTVNRQFRGGLTVYGSYVRSRTLGNGQSTAEADNTARPLDYYNLKLEKSVVDFDTPNDFRLYVGYELPVGRGKALWGHANRVTNAIIGGWSLSAILNYASGWPLTFAGSFPLSGGWNGVTNRINIAPGPLLNSAFASGKFDVLNQSSPNDTYLNKAVFSDAPPLTLGSAAYAYTQARVPPLLSEDAGLQKVVKIRERATFQLRAEALNLFNRHRLGAALGAGNGVGGASYAPLGGGIVTNVTSPLFGQVTNVDGYRQFQIVARLDF